MARILMCVPTKDRAEMVREVLEYASDCYKKNDIEILYYDSSLTDDTLNVINEIKSKYSINIMYMRANPDLCLDYKLVELFKILENMSYDYYWLVNDSVSFYEEMVRYVKTLVNDEYDLIRLPLSGEGACIDYITEDVNDWFNNCSQGMAHMASTVMCKSLLIAEHNWENLSEKYIYNNTLDDKHGYFFTVGFYLEQIAKLKKFKGVYIGNNFKWRRDSPLKKNQIYWQKYVFETWAKSYAETIFKLPDIYTNKEQVIRKSDNIQPGRFSAEMLIHYRLTGIYDVNKYKNFKNYFKYITDEKLITCFAVAVTPKFVLKAFFSSFATVESDWEEKLEQIMKKIKGKKIIIYGAGLYGEKTAKKLAECGLIDQVIGIAVTNSDVNMKIISGIEVHSIDYFTSFKDNAVVLICTLPAAAKEIKKTLMRKKYKNIMSLFGN